MEMCPSCRQPRNLRRTVSVRPVTGADGKVVRRVRTVSYHCEHCHRFVRSEDLEEPVAA
ncbi:MAG: hypothetical protein AB1505_21620 [Candidatus Latescibacterota bacterium]